MRSLAAAVLGMETIVTLLVVPAVAVSDRSHAGWWAVLVGVLAAALGAAPVLLRRRHGAAFGSVLQVAFVATGFLVWPMWVIGALFAALWAQALRMQPAP